MKKLIALFSALILAVTLTACAGGSSSNQSSNDSGNQSGLNALKLETLDKTLTLYELSIKYPSDWTTKVGDYETDWLYPPCGGMVQIQRQVVTTSIDSRTADSVAISHTDEYIKGFRNSADIGQFDYGEYKVSTNGNVKIVTAPVSFSINSVLYNGCFSLYFDGYFVYSIIGGIPQDADDQYLQTLDAIIQTVEIS